ncbi:MAG: EAL domain-containing protein, partial [Lachnospiraceae bacterium]|nr:EAL domain-containing protein [Lachnospiraceae bacterium]
MDTETKRETQDYIELDVLTGLYAGNTFFIRVDELKERIENNTYCMVSVDVEHFRVFNKLYGRAQGNELLIGIAEYLKEFRRRCGGLIGYLGGDNYGIFMPYKEEYVNELCEGVTAEVAKFNTTVGFLPAFGLYRVDDISLPAGMMYDRATIAMAHVVGNYQVRLCEYNHDMEKKVEEEIRILAEVQEGLKKDEFVFYVQPQCDIATGKIVGGESLVRWKHSTKGMISPGAFIPILENNGFIADLDRYIWDKVCHWLRSWLDSGHQPVPISINVSRIDIFSMDVPAYL